MLGHPMQDKRGIDKSWIRKMHAPGWRNIFIWGDSKNGVVGLASGETERPSQAATLSAMNQVSRLIARLLYTLHTEKIPVWICVPFEVLSVHERHLDLL